MRTPYCDPAGVGWDALRSVAKGPCAALAGPCRIALRHAQRATVERCVLDAINPGLAVRISRVIIVTIAVQVASQEQRGQSASPNGAACMSRDALHDCCARGWQGNGLCAGNFKLQ